MIIKVTDENDEIIEEVEIISETEDEDEEDDKIEDLLKKYADNNSPFLAANVIFNEGTTLNNFEDKFSNSVNTLIIKIRKL